MSLTWEAKLINMELLGISKVLSNGELSNQSGKIKEVSHEEK
jgi:hypothetical protein